MFSDMRTKICDVQKSGFYQKRISPIQSVNPEYWNPDYVLVTNLKAFFVNAVIKQNLPTNDMVAWIDFGYCRNEAALPNSKSWKYNFNQNKFHLFNYKPYDGKPIEDVIAENDVYILGAQAIGHKKLWSTMDDLMTNSFRDLLSKDLVDDDQGLWLNSYLCQPEMFELHLIPDHQKGHDPFVLFHWFNTAC